MASEKSKSRASEKKDKSEKSKKSKNSSKKTPPPATFKSAEFVQDSDEEAETGNKKVADDESSNSDSTSSSAKPVKASKANGKLPAPEGSSSSSEDERAESDESSEDEDESEDATSKAPVAIEPTKQPAKQPISNTVTPKAPYQPPPGFDMASLDGALEASKLLKKSSLEGKQIWYFTAPASVPISSIKAMNLLDAKNGKVVMTHDGNDYGFMKDSAEDTTYTRIMVPSLDAGYKATSKSIDQVFRLQQVARDPTTANSGRATIPARKPVRQQPRGLKMRFHPIGFGDAKPGTIGSSSSDEEMEDAPSRTSRPVSKSKLTNYAGGDTSDEEMVDSVLPSRPHPDVIEASSKKEKKRKHREDGEKKSKHSSSAKIRSTDHRELKQLKKKQTESQRNPADNPSASIEGHENQDLARSPQPKLPLKPLVSMSAIPPPKLSTFSQPSSANTVLHRSNSSAKKRKAAEEQLNSLFNSLMTPSSMGTSSLKDATRAADLELTEEKRRKQIKKQKRHDAKRQMGSPV